jgi:hypothetical protein
LAPSGAEIRCEMLAVQPAIEAGLEVNATVALVHASI